MPQDGRLSRIDLHDLAAVLEIYINPSGAIGRALLRFSTQWEALDYFVGFGIDVSGIVRPAIESENMFGGRLKTNRIRIHSCLWFADFGQRLEIENRDAVRLPIRNEPFPEFGRNGHSVNSMQLRDLPNQ